MKVYEKLSETHEPRALATVIDTVGSSPSEPAMKMLIGPTGRLAGTIGGGHVEATVEAKGIDVLASGKSEVLSFTLDDDLADEGGLICGGTIRVLVERVAPPARWADEACEAIATGERAVVLARVGDAVERLVLRGDDATPYLGSEEPRLEDDLFVEPLVAPRCIVIGAGHVGRAVAAIAKTAGFLVTVLEDREEQAARVEADRVIVDDLIKGLAEAAPGPDDFVVSLTRGHGLDLHCVRAALQTPARYVGMLSSRRKAETIRKALAKDGIDAERLHAPVGLDLAASSAGEIAVSVVAQLVKVRRLGRGDR